MENLGIKNAIDKNYDFIMSLDGLRSVQVAYGCELTHKKDKFIVGNITSFPNHSYPCVIKNIFISDETKTVFISYTEVESEE